MKTSVSTVRDTITNCSFRSSGEFYLEIVLSSRYIIRKAQEVSLTTINIIPPKVKTSVLIIIEKSTIIRKLFSTSSAYLKE